METRRPRINIVIGLTPWLTYVSEKDKYIQNEYFGKSIKEIVENKLFIKQEI